MKSRKICFYIFTILSLAFNVLIIVESCVGGGDSASQSFSFSEALADFVENLDPSSTLISDRVAFHAVIRKLVGHFLLFGMSGIFTTLSFFFNDFFANKFKWKNLIFISLIGFSVALISELIQYFTPGRYGALTYILIDSSGFLSFMGLTYLIIYLAQRKNNKAIKEND